MTRYGSRCQSWGRRERCPILRSYRSKDRGLEKSNVACDRIIELLKLEILRKKNIGKKILTNVSTGDVSARVEVDADEFSLKEKESKKR